MPVGSGEEIRRRLLRFVSATFKNWSAMEKAAEIPHPTAVAWKRKGAALPNTDSLLKLARLRLSLDWLVTGLGPMQLHPFSLGRGALLENLRPFLQRRFKVGDHTGSQALAAMILRLGEDSALEKAADGLAADYHSQLLLLSQLHKFGELARYVWDQLAVIERTAKITNKQLPNETVELLRARLFDYLPEEFRPGSRLHTEYWEVIDSGRRKLVQAARKQIEDQTST